MAELLNQWILLITDPVLGWLLRLPADLRIVIVALATSLILKLVRMFTTDQSLLRRVADDKKRLAELIRQARCDNDKAAVKRYKANKGMVAMRVAKQEFMPLLVAIIPLALLATWAWCRLEFHPPQDNEPVELMLYTPASSVGQLAHLVPADGLKVAGYVQEVVPDPSAATASAQPFENGVARWVIRADSQPDPYKVAVRCGAKTWTHPLLVGQLHYHAPLLVHEDGWATHVALRPVKLFNIIPGIAALGFPPWLVAYLLIVIVMMPIMTRLTGIR